MQGVRRHSTATLKDAMEEASRPEEVSENRSNLEITKIAKEPAVPCVPPHLDASLRNEHVDESGCRLREIYGDNGTFFRKLSAKPIRPTGMLLVYLAPL